VHLFRAGLFSCTWKNPPASVVYCFLLRTNTKGVIREPAGLMHLGGSNNRIDAHEKFHEGCRAKEQWKNTLVSF
jgi:hypothetical protein